MEKNKDRTLGFFLISRFILIIVFCLSLNAQDSTNVLKKSDSTAADYPGKPLLMSLLVPGLGQLSNKEPLWKPSLFFGTEILSVAGFIYANRKAEDIRVDYQNFANQNWSLQNWYNFTQLIGIEKFSHNGKAITNSMFDAMKDYTGTHHITIHLKGAVKNALNTEFLSSDSLGLLAVYLGVSEYSDLIGTVNDRHFYENIGKYDQFVGGWSDARTDWYYEEKDVGDSIEIIIKTPKKQLYLDQRYDSNQWLSIAKFSVSAMMLNHVFSGLEAVWSKRKKSNKIKKSEMDLGLLYNPENKMGVGGLSLRFNFK